MTIFPDDRRGSETFNAWRRAQWNNPDAFFANQRGQHEWMLHRPSCPHFEDPAVEERTWSITAHEKVCGTRDEIEREVGRRHLTVCADCVARETP